jgi:2-polyprenyl-3-methyl-5-hydroxy-6-metoxy-1,4-benzoquinol methylase
MSDTVYSAHINDEGERLVPDLHHDAVSFAEHMVRYLFVSRLVKGKVVLDVASGVGYGSELMKAAGARRVTALDYSAEATRYGKGRYAGEGIEYVTGDAQELPFRDGSMDVIASFETIEHLPNPARFLEEVRRTLRLGGVLVLSTPNRGVFVEGNPYHLHEFTYDELETLLQHSFKNVRTYVQDDWISSTVLTPEEMEKQDYHLNGPIHTYKAMSRAASQALFVVSICSDGELPTADKQAVMTEIYEMKGFLEELARKDEQIVRLAELPSILEAKDRHITDFQRMIEEKDDHLANMQTMISERDRSIDELKHALAQSQDEARALRNSLGYRLFTLPAAVVSRLRRRNSGD